MSMTFMIKRLFILGALSLASVQADIAYQQDELDLYPQPREIRVTPRLNAGHEQSRLRQEYMWSDVQATGFFVNPKTSLSVEVSGLDGEHGARLAFGPPALVNAENKTKDFTDDLFYTYSGGLRNGDNNVVDHQGGIIYVQYTYKKTSIPPPKITVRLGRGAQPFPWYQQNKSNATLFMRAMKSTKIPYAELDGQRVLVTGLESSARSYMDYPNIDVLLDTYATIISAQDQISGLDGRPGNAPSSLRPVIVQTSEGVEANAGHYRAAIGTTNYKDMWSSRALKRSWKIWHELGHQRQHTKTWSWPTMDEVTVNIYALAAKRQLSMLPDDEKFNALLDHDEITHGTHQEWEAARAYLELKDAQKDFEKADEFIQLVMFEQLRLAFGDGFYHAMHQASRRMKLRKEVAKGKRRELFMLEAAKWSDTDLGPFFEKWGMRPKGRVRDLMRRHKRPERDYTLLETYKESR